MATTANAMTPENVGRILEAGLFDAGYYLSTYREEIPSGMDAFEHFATIGLARGFKPTPRFDPLVYRILHPEVGLDDPVLHFLDQYGAGPAEFRLQDALRLVEKTPTFLPTKVFDIDLKSNNAACLAAAARLADARTIALEVAGRSYRLLVPPPEALFDRLRDDNPFAFARLSHGDWDAIYVYERYRGRVARAVAGLGFSDQQVSRLTMRLCDEFYPGEAVFAENVLPEMFADLRRHVPNDDLMIAVSFKGFPTADEQLFYRTLKLKPVDIARLRIFADFFDPAESLYDANLFKRWSIAGPIRHLPALARQRPVIFMGGERLASLGKRWSLPWLLHLCIPPHNSYPLRHDLLRAAREKIAEANDIARAHNTGRPLFLMQGSSFAYWFMVRLVREYPDIFYLDLGQSLHIWFYDREDIPFMAERELYGRTIVRNCELEDYYRNLGSILTPELHAPPDDGGETSDQTP